MVGFVWKNIIFNIPNGHLWWFAGQLVIPMSSYSCAIFLEYFHETSNRILSRASMDIFVHICHIPGILLTGI